MGDFSTLSYAHRSPRLYYQTSHPLAAAAPPTWTVAGPVRVPRAGCWRTRPAAWSWKQKFSGSSRPECGCRCPPRRWTWPMSMRASLSAKASGAQCGRRRCSSGPSTVARPSAGQRGSRELARAVGDDCQAEIRSAVKVGCWLWRSRGYLAAGCERELELDQGQRTGRSSARNAKGADGGQ